MGGKAKREAPVATGQGAAMAVFLRGMNLGKRRISNDELCAAFRHMGFDGVGAFLASGNVVLGGARSDGDTSEVESFIARGLEESLHYPVPAFVRTALEMRRIAEHAPFSAEQLEGTAGKVQVVMASVPLAKVGAQLLGLTNGEDKLALGDKELYWLPRNGLSDSDFDIRAVEALLGTVTVRGKRTIDRMTAKFF